MPEHNRLQMIWVPGYRRIKGTELLISWQRMKLNIHLQHMKWPVEPQKVWHSRLDEQKTSGIQTVHIWKKHVVLF
jgi:hypothetical protein